MKTRAWILLTALSIPAAPAAADPIDSSRTFLNGETLRYRWRLRGVGGIIATLVPTYPSAGYGVLQSTAGGTGRLVSEFRATPEKASTGQHWVFRSELDLASSRTLRVEERWAFRGKSRETRHELASQPGIDMLSELQLLRISPPQAPCHHSIWSDGKLYRVLVTPDRQPVARWIADRRIALRRVSVRGVRAPGEPFWKGVGEIWFTEDGRALPVEIRLRRKFGQLRLVLLEPPGPGPSALRSAAASAAGTRGTSTSGRAASPR